MVLPTLPNAHSGTIARSPFSGWRTVQRQFSREVVSRRATLIGGLTVIAIGFSLPISLSLTEIGIGIVLTCWLLTGRFREQAEALRHNPVALATLALVTLLVLSVFYGAVPLGESFSVLRKYRSLVYLALFSVVFRPAWLRAAGLLAFETAMALILLGSFLTAAGIRPIENRYTLDPANATVLSSHIVHGICMAVFTYLMAHRFVDQPRWRWLTGPLMLMAAANALFMVAGRTGYLTLATLIVLFCFQRLQLRHTAAVVAMAAMVLVAGYFQSETFSTRVRDADAEVRAYLDYRFGDGPLKPEGWRRPVNRTSCGVRLDWYCAGLGLLAQRPWLGVGVGNVKHHLELTAADTGVLPTYNLHSEYVMVAAQTGLFGLALTAWLIVTYWRTSRRLSPEMRHVAQGILMMFLVAGFANTLMTERTEGVLFAFFSGLAFSELSERAIRARAKHAEDSEPAVDEEPPQALARAA